VLARVVGEPPRLPFAALSMVAQIEFEIHDSLILPDGIVELVLEFGATGVQEMDTALQDCSLQPFFDAWAAGFPA